MSESDDFLSRWARRKREAEIPSPMEASIAPLPELEAEPDVDPENLDLESLDLESLPSVESITESTDIRGFLRSGVPAELTRSALRQAWASDPAIRDFIGIAENQWDFNDPNAIPGFGPLLQTDDVPALLVQALGRLTRIVEAVPDTMTPPRAAVIASRDAPPEQTNEILSAADPGIGARGSADHDAAAAIEKGVSTSEEDTPPDNRRLHGSALPR
jgi:uncharacterized protein DUF3306